MEVLDMLFVLGFLMYMSLVQFLLFLVDNGVLKVNRNKFAALLFLIGAILTIIFSYYYLK